MAEEHEEHDQGHDHDHGNLNYGSAEVEDAVLERLKTTHPALAENLSLAKRYAELDDKERARLVETQDEMEKTAGWKPGYHAEGDKCGGCGKEVEPLFHDVFAEGGRLSYAPLLHEIPVHDDESCVTALQGKIPRPAPMILDRIRRATMAEGGRASAKMAMFLRHDIFAHPPFGLEDWANSVADANPKMDRATRNDMERVLRWVHGRLFH